MITSHESLLGRWVGAGLLDGATASRIRQWESVQQPAGMPNRLAAVAFGLGGLLLIAGTLLFVSAHWDTLGPAARFALVLGAVGMLHLAAAASTLRSQALATTLHAAGTAALGAGIFLAGQIFNLAEHWPGALLVWTLGAVCALLLLRDWPHVLWVAVLMPSWLWGEWLDHQARAGAVELGAAPAVGTAMLALAYLSADFKAEHQAWRRTLSRLGALGFLPAAFLVSASGDHWSATHPAFHAPFGEADAVAWCVAVALTFAVGVALIGKRAVGLAVALAWCLAVARLRWDAAADTLALYGLWALGAVGLAAWGARAQRARVVNLAVLMFALTTLGFYFSSVFDKLGRSLSLIVGGVLLLLGGWCLERLRRHLISAIKEERA